MAAQSSITPLHAGLLSFAARFSAAPARQVVQSARSEIIRTPRLFLRSLRDPDAREFLRVARENRAHLALRMPLYLEDERDEAMVARQLAQVEAGDATGRDWRRIAFDMRGSIVGGVNINDIRRGLENRGEINLWVSLANANQGLAAEILRAAIDHAFAPLPLLTREPQSPGLGLDRLDALIAPTNAPSIKLLTRAGFGRDHSEVPIDLIVSGRHEAHDRYVLCARPTTSAGQTVHEIKHLPEPMRQSLRAILHAEGLDRLW